MQIRGDALSARLAGGIAPVVWIHGDEPLLLIEAADAVREAARAAGYGERIVIDADRSTATERLREETASLSLFSQRKLIELRLPGRAGAEPGRLVGECAPTGEDVRVLVTSGRLDRAATGSDWFARIDAIGLVVAVAPVPRERLPAWIAARLERQSQRADAQALALIAERVEGNLLAAHQEIRKLGLLYPAGRLDVESVRAAVHDVARFDSFGLLEAALAGDVRRAERTLDGLRAEGQAPPSVLFALADGARTLVRLFDAQAGGRPLAQAMREAHVYAQRESLYRGALARLSRGRAIAALRAAVHADTMTKGLVKGDEWHALRRVALLIAGAPVLADPAPS